jgi:uncharacterized protein
VIAPASTPAAAPGPVRTTERVSRLDAMRGFALLGIMFVNMTWFTGFAVLSGEQREALGTAGVDRVTAWIVHFAVDSKFWTLFALLFGVGFGIQAVRAGAPAGTGDGFAVRYARRMGVLFLIGAAHAVFLWFGDIVSLYAAVGIFLLLFRRCRGRTLVGWAAALLLSPIVVSGCWLAAEVARFVLGDDTAAVAGDPGHGPAELLVVFGAGSYGEVLRANWAFLVERWYLAVYSSRFPALLGMFLLGFWAARRGIVQHPERHDLLLRRVVRWGLLVGVPANALLATFVIARRPPTALGWLSTVVASIGTPALALAYAGLFVRVFAHPIGAGLLAPFAWAGRLSLTNYVLQSAIGVTIFYGCGIGLWGKVGITASLAFIAAIFCLQTVASRWWLGHFEQGPLEWIWRCLSYGRRVPLRRRRSGPRAAAPARPVVTPPRPAGAAGRTP